MATKLWHMRYRRPPAKVEIGILYARDLVGAEMVGRRWCAENNARYAVVFDPVLADEGILTEAEVEELRNRRGENVTVSGAFKDSATARLPV